MSLRTLITSRFISSSALAALAAISFGVAANAAPLAAVSDAPSIRVSVADLDLNADAGAKAAFHRIQLAARDVCGGQPLAIELDRMAPFKACVQSATDNAVAQLGSAQVTALNDRSASDSALRRG